MAQFDVYLGRNRARSHMIDVQTDFLSDLHSLLVVPLVPAASSVIPITRLNPLLKIEDTAYVMATHLATAVPLNQLGERVVSLAEHRDEIIAAIDVLITGI